jgi:alkylmercury lyase
MATADLKDWARQLADASPNLDTDERRLFIQLFHLLALGRPVTPAEIASASGLDEDMVEESLRTWPLVLWDDQDRVVGFWGLQAHHVTPTHAMEVGGITSYGWCAWDTLFIPGILGKDAHVTSTDPNDGSTVSLTVTPTHATDVSPPEAVVSVLLPESGFTDDAIQRFCHQIHFFSSADSAKQWMADRPGMHAITVDDAFEVGRLTNQLRLGIGSDETAPPVQADR